MAEEAETPLSVFQRLRSEYALMPSIFSGMGQRGQDLADEHYELLRSAHLLLSTEEQNANRLPRRHTCFGDDGAAGMIHGWAYMAYMAHAQPAQNWRP